VSLLSEGLALQREVFSVLVLQGWHFTSVANENVQSSMCLRDGKHIFLFFTEIIGL